tara:strand:+ start:3677 stop:4207 length:531 start_codon:yes stop_codon:yes gene_type:complete
MPERVTKEERQISLLIEKARDAKETLIMSLENNRNPVQDESEVFKLKRPKAENYEAKFVSNDGPATNHAYAGEMVKFSKIKKMLEDIIKSNPVWDEEAKEGIDNVYEKLNNAQAQLSKIMADVKAGKTDMDGQMGAIQSILTMLNQLKMLSGGNIREGPEDPHTELVDTDDPTLDE